MSPLQLTLPIVVLMKLMRYEGKLHIMSFRLFSSLTVYLLAMLYIDRHKRSFVHSIRSGGRLLAATASAEA